MAINFEEIAGLLGIDVLSARIYVELLMHGRLTATKIAKFLLNPARDIENGLGVLVDRGLAVCRVEDEGEKIFRPVPVLELEENFKGDPEVVRDLKKIISSQIEHPRKVGIVKYEGWEGIRTVFLEVLAEAKRTGEDILAFEANVSSTDLGEEFTDNYVKKRMESEIKAYVICPLTEEDRKYKEQFEGNLTEVRLRDGLNIDANINVVGDLVMTFSTNPPQGTLRRNKAEANTLRAVFWALWRGVDSGS